MFPYIKVRFLTLRSDITVNLMILINAFCNLCDCSKCRPLWAFEDITSKVHRIKSAESLELLLKYFVRIYKESLPAVHIQQRWAQEAIHLALSCSSRHYAGRSFQVRLFTSSICLYHSSSTDDTHQY